MDTTARTPEGRALRPHDGAAEAFVCRPCGLLVDLVGGTYEGYTQEDADAARCPHCGGTDTAWLWADDGPDEPGRETRRET